MHISVIDDEKMLANRVLKKLESSGYAASAFYGYEDFMRNGDSNSQLYIVDLSLGDGTGFDIIRYLRENQRSVAPIIIISGYGDSENIIYGLDLGADDYLTKPVIPEELVARVKAILRRPTALITDTILEHGSIAFNTNAKETTIDGKPVYLTKTEGLILEFFLINVGRIMSREKLVTHVWGGHRYEAVSDNTINVTLSNIRKKLGPDFILRTVYNQGYILEK